MEMDLQIRECDPAIIARRLVDGFPTGIEIVAPYLEDRTTLKFVQLLEHDLDGFIPPPSL